MDVIVNISGIYLIVNIINNKIYVGSSYKINARWSGHKHELRLNKHHSILLQRAWNKYGEENFKFVVLEYVDKKELIEREQYWLDKLKCYDKRIGYNHYLKAGSPLGIKQSEETKAKRRGQKRSEEVKLKISKGVKGIIKSEKWQNNIKQAILSSNKVFKNKRNVDKWPHEKGKRCKCDECREKIKFYMRENYFNKKVLTQNLMG